jgi:hypothetical protein
VPPLDRQPAVTTDRLEALVISDGPRSAASSLYIFRYRIRLTAHFTADYAAINEMRRATPQRRRSDYHRRRHYYADAKQSRPLSVAQA